MSTNLPPSDALWSQLAHDFSRRITHRYSTSFSLGIRLFHRSIRLAIYDLYGFVRLADEVVDSFSAIDQSAALRRFRTDYRLARQNGFSLNPVLHAFVQTGRRYDFDPAAVEAFLDSMAMDLHPRRYNQASYQRYIHGSAAVVGLLCLAIFCGGRTTAYQRLSPAAQSLGRAYQVVNFLRDVGSDTRQLHRAYFPGMAEAGFSDAIKRQAEAEATQWLAAAEAILPELPRNCRLGVRLSVVYYRRLLRKIKRRSAAALLERRVRLSNPVKLLIMAWVLLAAIPRREWPTARQA